MSRRPLNHRPRRNSFYRLLQKKRWQATLRAIQEKFGPAAITMGNGSPLDDFPRPITLKETIVNQHPKPSKPPLKPF